jgi:sulfoxide reductase heme-binding subunit YedZ
MYLVVALIATSLLRRHLGQRAWRLVHWTSYLMWPLAFAHTVTAGSDAMAPWMLAVEAICLAIIAGAATWRWVDRGATMALGSRALAR